MALIDLMTKEIIRVPMSAKTKPEVIRELVDVLKDAGKVSEIDPIVDALMERERKGSTGLEMGIAVPHCKTPLVKDMVLAIGIAPDGVDFDSLDGEPSKLFFLLLAPPDQSGPHIEALSEIARLAQSSSFYRALVESRNAEEVVELFAE